MRQQLDAVLLDSLGPFILGIGFTFIFALMYIGFLLGSAFFLASVPLGLALAAVFFKIYRLLKSGQVPARLAHPLAGSISMIGFALLIFSLVTDAEDSVDLRFMGLALSVVLSSALYLALRWMIGSMAFMFATWIVLYLALGYEFIWPRYLPAMAFIALASLVSYAVHKQAIVKMLEAQQENVRQNDQLTGALERAHRSEAELRVERQIADQVVDSMGQGLMLLDSAGLIEYVNPAATAIFGESMNELTGQSADDLLQGRVIEPLEQLYGDSISPGETEETIEASIILKDGTVSNLLISVAVREGGGKILTFTDMTPQKRFEERLVQLAHHDALTGLANRPHLIERLEKVASDRRQRISKIAVLFIDLDRFKLVNDTMGHATGDRVLIETAHRIECCIREQDIAARFGGDEFIVVLVDIESEDKALQIAERIVESIEQPFVLPDSIETLSASIGVSVSQSPDIKPEELIHQADIAMYRAKRDRSVSSVVYRSDMHARVRLLA